MGSDTSRESFDEKEYEDFSKKQNEELLGKGNSSWPEPYGSLFSDSLKTHTTSFSSNNVSTSVPPSPSSNNTTTTQSSFTSSSSVTPDEITEEERRQAVAALRIFNRVARRQSGVFNALIQNISNNNDKIKMIHGLTDLYNRSILEGKSVQDARRDNVWCSDRIFILAAAMRNAQEQRALQNSVLKGPALLNLRTIDLSNCHDLNLSYTNSSNYFIDHNEYLSIEQKVHVVIKQENERKNDVIFGSIIKSRVPSNTVNILYANGKISYGVPKRYLLNNSSSSSSGSSSRSSDEREVRPWKQCSVGRAYYGDRGTTPKPLSNYLMSPVSLSSLYPFYIVQEVNIVINTYSGCKFNTNTTSNDQLTQQVLTSLGKSVGDFDESSSIWVTLPITCELNDDVERAIYTLKLLYLKDSNDDDEKEKGKGKERTKRTVIEYKVRCLCGGDDRNVAGVEFIPLKYNLGKDLKKPNAVVELKKGIIEFRLPHGLSLGVDQTHILSSITSDNNIITELPPSILTTSLIAKKLSKEKFHLLKNIFQNIIENRQTNILTSSMKSNNVDSLYSIPASLGANNSDTICRVMCREVPINNNDEEKKGTTNETYTIMLNDGSIEYNVPRENVSLSAKSSMNEKAFLNVSNDKQIHLT